MISKDLTVKEIIEIDASLIDVFNNYGFKGLDNPHVLKQIGGLTLEALLKTRGKNADVFVELLNETLESKNIDVTLQDGNKNGSINLVGLLPCPVRLPLLEALSKTPEIKNINHNLKAASEGLDWLKEEVLVAKTEEDLADIYISAGFDLFFEQELMKRFKDDKVFKDYHFEREINKDFDNEEIALKDPNHDYSMFAVVPAVFLVNTQVLGERPMPKTWKDLLDPIYESSVSLPVSDFDLFNAILIHIYKDYGLVGVNRLGKQMIASMHPAQMVKSERRARIKPAISIMPYFFTKMALPGSVMQAVWPEDGAIVSPIFMLTKKSKEEGLKAISEFFLSKEVGEILSHKGLFPSTHKDVDNKILNPKFNWIGWDYIDNNDIGTILKKCMTEFEKGMK
ncbi:MAG: ABC transporter substrate-binding protein [Tenericutes bacterium]|nr:ABC transporter substrate-binding protein [Mycoplasmatota bacterium]